MDNEKDLEYREVFVAHHFIKEELDDFRSVIEKVLGGHNLIPYYTDQDLGPCHILCKICRKIRNTQFGIYDISNEKCTGKPNPNVTLELGMAYGFGKHALLTARKGSRILSDISGFDRIEYQSYKELFEELNKKMDKFLNNHVLCML